MVLGWWKRLDHNLTALAVVLGCIGMYYLIIGVQGSPAEGVEEPVMSFANAFLGIGLMVGGCLAAIIARVRQAECHHKEALIQRDSDQQIDARGGGTP
jgi:hypothetical protein